MVDEARKDELLEKANVVAVGDGENVTDGQKTGEDAVKVFVTEKKDLSSLADKDVVPEDVDGTQTDVEPVGEPITPEVSYEQAVEAQNKTADPTERHRPVHMGVSISPIGERYAGTAGGLFYKYVERETDNYIVKLPKPVVLTNNHVGAAVDKLDPGHVIIQPGTIDGGKTLDEEYAVLRLAEYNPITDGGKQTMDAAYLDSHDEFADKYYDDVDSLVNSYIPQVGTPRNEVVDVEKGDTIHTGRTRTTPYRRGEVKATNADVRVNYGGDHGVITFKDQILTESVSKPGDSGSIGLKGHNPFGLLFAGSSSITVFTPLQRVLDAFDLHVSPAIEVEEK